jgi:flagellar biosynthesis/type III secretory pathway ATPase
LEGQGIHRLIPTRFGQMLYNVYDVSVGRTLEICGEWLGGERSIYQQLQLGSAPVTGCWRQMFQVSVSFQVRVIDNLLTMIFHKMVW